MLISSSISLKYLKFHSNFLNKRVCQKRSPKLSINIFLSARPLVVVEYAQYGDVLGYLRKSRGVHDNYYSDPSVQPRTSLTSEQLLKFAWEISDGMDYLSKKKVIN